MRRVKQLSESAQLEIAKGLFREIAHGHATARAAARKFDVVETAVSYLLRKFGYPPAKTLRDAGEALPIFLRDGTTALTWDDLIRMRREGQRWAEIRDAVGVASSVASFVIVMKGCCRRRGVDWPITVI